MTRANRDNDFALVEIGCDHWVLVQVLRITPTPTSAWNGLFKRRPRCVIETAKGSWAGCMLSAVLTDREDGHQLLMRIPEATLLFESRAPAPALDAAHSGALQKLFTYNKVRFERRRNGVERWFALC